VFCLGLGDLFKHDIHIGHLSLVKEAKENNDLVVASIYVNPTQFGEGEDLDKYPRTFQRDSELLNDYGVVSFGNWLN
jgi:pantoate--beta-alanine ligase